MRKTLPLLCVFTLLLTGSAARADFIPPPPPPKPPVTTDSIPWDATGTGTVVFNNNNSAGTSFVTLTGLTLHGSTIATIDHNLPVALGTGPGGAPPILFNVNLTTTAMASAPDSFTNVPIAVGVSLTDVLSLGKPSAVSTAMLQFAGTVSDRSVSQSAVVPGGAFWNPPNSVQVTLGSPGDWRTYTVSMGGFDLVNTNLAPTRSGLRVTIAPASAPGQIVEPPPIDTPEPAGLVLAGLALPTLLLTRRRWKGGAAVSSDES